jgi:hypothetical protein
MTGGTGGTGADASGGQGGTVIPPPPTEIAECQGHVYQCGDLEDNDMDGLVDYQDEDCTGPCDDTEDSLFGGIPGQNNAPCQMDCYWDQDTGPGNDECYWDHRCDTHEEAPEYYPEPNNGSACEYDEAFPVTGISGGPVSCQSLRDAQSQECADYCGPITPNGCDCFGCCEMPVDSGSYVWLGSVGAGEDTVCTWEEIANPDICHPCDPVPSCLNDCDTCELCLGKTTLPPECYDPEDPDPQECDNGEFQPCGLPGQDPCPAGTFCLTGCCVPVPQ